ncbi:MAG: single-stranded DNA-binding protein, partial [Actinomycetes bacterium]
MAEIPIAVVGNVATSVQGKLTSAGRVASFRLASNVRRFDRTRGIWYDAETNYFTVTCWRQLADNVLSSLSKGDPVVVSGRIHVRAWKNAEREGITVEIEAGAVGHDMSRGTSAFRRKEPEPPEPVVDGSQVDELHRMIEAEGDEPVDPADLDRAADAEPGETQGRPRPETDAPGDSGHAGANGDGKAGAGGSRGPEVRRRAGGLT